jgi:hypothetical protein
MIEDSAIQSMLREPLSPDSGLNSSLNASMSLSQSWGCESTPSLSSSCVLPSFNRKPKMMRPLSLASSYNGGVSGGLSSGQFWQNSHQANSLANILANTSIQGLTNEHIAKLLSPVDINSNIKLNSNDPNEIDESFTQVLSMISELN